MARQQRWSRTHLRSPWERIVSAANRGTGCRLTRADCRRLAQDDAIVTRAYLDEAERQGGDEPICPR